MSPDTHNFVADIFLGMNQFLILIMLIVMSLPGMAQHISSLRTLKTSAASDTVTLDELFVSPSSVTVFDNGEQLDAALWAIEGNRLVWKERPQADTVIIKFRVFPFALAQKRQQRDVAMIFPPGQSDYIGNYYAPQDEPDVFFSSQGLDYNGSFSRGIAFGNRQNLSLNSHLNLQLSGNLGDDVELLAAISDNNLPIQPQGNTSQLQEFDRVFIQMRRKDGQLTAGDYELSHSEGHFMRYYKRLQGASASDAVTLSNGGKFKGRAGLAISRGKFSRNAFTGTEGNQGPYRLKGADGEDFIIVLAGTEKVFVDGRLMKRGQDFDYIIDYNRGTLVFTSNRLITKDIRIIVEFEYATRQYLRTLQTVDAMYEHGPLRVYASAYSEQDGRFSGAARDLTPEQISELTQAGDAPGGVLAPGQRPGELSNDPVLYRKIASPIPCQSDSIFVQASPEEGGIWAVSFSEVGAGKGNYRRLPAEAFGTAFEWVAPGADCQPSGDYAAVVRLLPPGQQQLYTAGIGMQWSEHSSLRAEAALSRTDLNRFSTLGDDDNSGLAVFLEGQHRMALAESPWSLAGALRYEGVQRQFKALNPWREAEFVRNWNLEPVFSPEQEHLGAASVSLHHRQNGNLQYQASGFSRGTAFAGFRHETAFNWAQGGWEFTGSGNWLQTESPDENTSFSRPNFSVAKSLISDGAVKTGIYFEQEQNKRSRSNVDSLHAGSFRYNLARWFAEYQGTEDLKWSLGYAVRWDYAPVAGEFAVTTTAHNYSLSGTWNPNSGSHWKWNLTYRQLEVSDSSLFSGDPRNTFLGRLEHRSSFLRGFARSSVVYDISSGQEQKVEFIYRPVQPGEQGTHLWEDRNSDGQIQFDEVELPPFPEAANVVRITQFTESFIRTENARLNAMLRLDPASLIRQTGGMAKFAGKWSAQITLAVDRKTRPADGVRTWDPLQLSIPDSSLIALTSTLRADLFMNRGQAAYDLQWSWIDQRNRVVLTTGYEGRRQVGQSFRARASLAPNWVAVGKIEADLRVNDSEFFDTRDYFIRSLEFRPEIQWQPSAAFRTSLAFKLRSSQNTLPDEFGESATQNDLNISITFNRSASTAISASVSMVQVDFNGLPNTPVSFAMLDGLQDGRNYLWNISVDRRLENNIQLNFSYEGRQTGIGPLIHIGRAEVRAAF